MAKTRVSSKYQVVIPKEIRGMPTTGYREKKDRT